MEKRKSGKRSKLITELSYKSFEELREDIIPNNKQPV